MDERHSEDKKFILETNLAAVAMKRRDVEYVFPENSGILLPFKPNVIIKSNIFDLNLEEDTIEYDSLDELLEHWYVD